MDVLLTGATGFVGPHVLRRLLERGDSVRVLALPDTVDRVPDHERIELVVGDLSEPDALAAAADGADVVYHLAARVVGASPRDLVETNVLGTEHLLTACGRGSIGRFVFISSVAVYAPAPDPELWPIIEDGPLEAHGSEALRSYGQSKIEGEALVQQCGREQGFAYAIVRPPAVYGPGAPWVEQWLQQLRRAPWQALAPRLKAFRMQWVHVHDLADGIVAAGTHREAVDQVFNVAGPEVFTPAAIVALLRGDRLHSGWLAPAPLAARPRDVLKYDITKAQRLLGYAPGIDLTEGIRDVLRGIRQEPRPPVRWAARPLAARGPWFRAREMA